MPKKLTTEEFIRKANQIHKGKYDYSKVIYIKAIEKVSIICKTHGEFLQTPNAHLCGYGCSKCGHTNKGKWTQEDFIKELKKRCGENLTYDIIGDYKGTTNNILIQNKYGICSIRANHLLNGVIAGIETAVDKNDYWINKAKEIHGELYDYSEINYVNSTTKITINCKIHGSFKQEPNSHLSGKGCGKCTKKTAGLKRSEEYSKKFKDKASKRHKGKYLYYEDTVFAAKDRICINCPIHGDFIQIADNHLHGDGCQKCGITLLSKRMQENPTGWNYTNWQKAGKRSSNFDSFKIYVIRCWNEDEEFYKIGKTFTTVEKRFKTKSSLPYEYEVDTVIMQNVEEVCKLEWILKNCNKENEYIPKIKFSGMYECFKELNMSCFEDYNITITD